MLTKSPLVRLRIGAALIAGLAATAALAARAPQPVDAQDAAGLGGKIAAAREEARGLAADLEAKQARLSEVAVRARQASNREKELGATLESARSEQARLEREADAAARRLDDARSRLREAQATLSDRLVAIYKGDEPDTLTVVLEADGFDDLLTRIEFLKTLNDSDQRLVVRVRDVRDEVRGDLTRVRAAEQRVREHVRKVATAREEIAKVRASAEADLAELREAFGAQQAAIRALRSRIDGWTAEVARLERIDRAAARRKVAAWIGGFAIPTGIVMCESGGNYGAVNPSSGAGGAYQIIPETWKRYGGKGKPQDGSRADQDRIAAEIWADSGGSAWVCAG